MVGRILTLFKDGGLERPCPYSGVLSGRSTVITSVRQTVEWGPGSVHNVYNRINIALPYDPKFWGSG